MPSWASLAWHFNNVADWRPFVNAPIVAGQPTGRRRAADGAPLHAAGLVPRVFCRARAAGRDPELKALSGAAGSVQGRCRTGRRATFRPLLPTLDPAWMLELILQPEPGEIGSPS
jgi:hypothetical protein